MASRCELPKDMTLERWYHLCRNCEAKWFSKSTRHTCPRCAVNCRSQVKAVPPWLALLKTHPIVDVPDPTLQRIEPLQESVQQRRGG